MLLYSLLVSNSTQNRDGTGFYNPTTGVYWKTEKAADLTKIELAKSLTEEVSETLIGHVRAAGFTNYIKVISTDKAHPFVSKNFVLFHNGSLERKSKLWNKEDEGLIDSEIFLNELEEQYKKEKDIVILLQKTMELFNGKFAFIIEHANHIYVVRGKTAELHTLDITHNGEKIGMIINTGEVSGERAVIEAGCYIKLIGKSVGFSSKFEELEKETIYEFLPDRSLVKLGELKETDRVVASVIRGYTPAGTGTIVDVSSRNIFTSDTSKRLYDYMVELGLNIEELDKLLFICVGTGILQLVPADLDDIWFYMEELKKRKNGSGNSKVLWDSIKTCTGEFRMDNYAKIDVQFPYFLEPNLKAILVRAKQESKDRKDAMII
jgi:hypothetical protein